MVSGRLLLWRSRPACQDASEASRQAAKLRPEWAATYVNIGASSYALGQYKDAVEAYRTAIKLDDDNADIQYSLGLTFNKMNRPEEEILAYRRALRSGPTTRIRLRSSASLFSKRGRYSEAATAFDQLKIYKPDAKTFNYLGESLIEINKNEEAIEALNNALGYNPDLDKARYNIGRAYIKIGNIDMARVQYEILRNSHSDWADRLYVLINRNIKAGPV